MKSSEPHPVILFDGICNLCNSSVQFVLKRDKKQKFRYASLQSEFGKKIIEQFSLKEKNIDSIVLIEQNRAWVKSSAVLRISKQLGGGYPLFYVFIIIPKFLRDAVYDFIARNRYRWFGKRESCILPSPETKTLFLDANE